MVPNDTEGDSKFAIEPDKGSAAFKAIERAFSRSTIWEYAESFGDDGINDLADLFESYSFDVTKDFLVLTKAASPLTKPLFASNKPIFKEDG